MKRTTLILEEDCFYDLKQLAAREKRSLSSLVDEMLRDSLQQRQEQRNAIEKVILPMYSMGETQANLADRDELEARMKD